MARAHHSDILVDAAGNIIIAAVGTLYTDAATSVLVDDNYTAASGGSLSSTVTTDSGGRWKVWFTEPKSYWIEWDNAGLTARYKNGTLLGSFTQVSQEHQAFQSPADEAAEDAAGTLAAHLADTADAHDASAISAVGVGTTFPANVETAITRLYEPYVLVNNYGADKTGVADSTAAINAAIAAAAARRSVPNATEMPTVAFLPGIYAINSTTTTINEANTPGSISFVGLGDEPRAVRLRAPVDGTTPAFLVDEKVAYNTVFKNFVSSGRLLRAEGAAHITLDDVVANPSVRGVAPIQLFNTFWFHWKGNQTAVEMGQAHTPILEYIGDTAIVNPTADTSYLLTIEDLIPTGGGVRLIQSGDTSNAAQQFRFNRISGEGLNADALVSVEVGKAFYAASLTSASTAVTVTDGDFTGADVGRRISHPAITAGTTIAAVTDATHITLSAAANATVTPVTVVVPRPITGNPITQLTFNQCDNHDQTGTCQMLRTSLNAAHSINATFINCSSLNLNRVWLNLQGNAFGTWIGASLANPLICDTSGAASATGFETVLSGSALSTGVGTTFGVFGATPATQPAGTTDVLAGLVTLGFRAASSNPPLDLGTGALTAGVTKLGGSAVATQVAVDSSGRVGQGVAANAAIMQFILNGAAHPGTGTTLTGVACRPGYPATTTVEGRNYHSQVFTAAAAFTLPLAYDFKADAPSLGAASAITTAIGFRAENHGATGVTNAYGVSVVAQSGAATLNVGIRSSGGTTANLWLDSDTATIAGGIAFGTTRDVNLYRRAADELRTDDKFLANAGIGVGNSAAATSLGSVAKKIEVFDAAGASLGFLPVYDAIT